LTEVASGNYLRAVRSIGLGETAARALDFDVLE